MRYTSPSSKEISIHALRKESDSSSRRITPDIRKFQSTLSVRRATYSPSHLTGRRSSISIHALRKESDVSPILDRIPLIFQSTLSVRRATVGRFDGPAGELISIHALRKESDLSVCDADVAY